MLNCKVCILDFRHEATSSDTFVLPFMYVRPSVSPLLLLISIRLSTVVDAKIFSDGISIYFNVYGKCVVSGPQVIFIVENDC